MAQWALCLRIQLVHRWIREAPRLSFYWLKHCNTGRIKDNLLCAHHCFFSLRLSSTAPFSSHSHLTLLLTQVSKYHSIGRSEHWIILHLFSFVFAHLRMNLFNSFTLVTFCCICMSPSEWIRMFNLPTIHPSSQPAHRLSPTNSRQYIAWVKKIGLCL